MFEMKPTKIFGCFQINPHIFSDHRGRFVKIFHKKEFSLLGIETNYEEEYYTTSNYGVVRGLHFQSPPFYHAKLIYCIQGEVFDVVLDLRVGSPTYGKTSSLSLGAELANCLYIPKGVAHGFCVLSEKATLVYNVSSVHSDEHDSGILWNSVNIDWPVNTPLLSDRDMRFPKFTDFVSPFFF